MKRVVRQRHRRGFFAIDVMMGLAILGIAAIVLISAITNSNRAARRLANSRQAARDAEAVLIALQAGLPAPAPDLNAKIGIEPCSGGAAVQGWHWVQIVASVDGQSRILVGLVPDGGKSDGGK